MVSQALADIDNELLHLAVHLAFVCSLRIGEAMGLTWDCIDFEHKVIHFDKTLQRVSKEALKILPHDSLIFTLYYRVVVIRAPLQGLCYTVRDAVDWLFSPTTRWFWKGSNHSPLQFC